MSKVTHIYSAIPPRKTCAQLGVCQSPVEHCLHSCELYEPEDANGQEQTAPTRAQRLGNALAYALVYGVSITGLSMLLGYVWGRHEQQIASLFWHAVGQLT